MPASLDATLRLVVLTAFIFNTVLVLVYVERKVLGHIQQRLGPMRTGFHGVLQTPADAIKLLVKEDLTPTTADRWVFRLAPFLVFVPVFMMFITLPFTRELAVRHLDLGIFYLVSFSSLHIVGMIMAGWGSDNKYALLGGVRAAAQLISYELPLAFAILGVVLLAKTLNLQEVVELQATAPFLVLQPLGFLIFLISSLAELSRTPFDIPMAESEVVGGPMIEYSGMRWAMFFLAEYANLFVTSAVAAVVYLGGWLWPFLPPADLAGGWAAHLVGLAWFMAKTFALILAIIWLRGTLPRLRIDQLMGFAWKLLIPFSFLNLFITAAAAVYGGFLLLLGWVATGGFAYAIYAVSRRRP
ncbi:MAG: NADH-quinone oxidoreductase subunit NuoH [Chloroflexi bacterium]|nr:NADH-quinone oxidoreductase subunit NuoH [Chloroflexota bacterium]